MSSSVRFFVSALALLASVTTVSGTTEDDSATRAEAVLQQELARASNQSLLWGPYNPGLYFGLRPRIPNSFRAALMWTSVDEFADFQNGAMGLCCGPLTGADSIPFRSQIRVQARGWDAWIWVG